MMLLKILRYDIKQCFLYEWKRLLCIALALLIVCIDHVQTVIFYFPDFKVTLLDSWFMLHKGMALFQPNSGIGQFNFIWITMHMLLFWMIIDVMMRAYRHSDGLLKSQSRLYWICSKFVCVSLLVLSYYLVMLFCSTVVVILFGQFQWSLSPEVVKVVCGKALTFSSNVTGCFMAPLCIMMIFGWLTLALSLCTNAAIALIVDLFLLLLPVFTNYDYILPTYLMLCRNGNLFIDESVNWRFSVIILALIVSIGCWCISIGVMKKKDFFFNEEER